MSGRKLMHAEIKQPLTVKHDGTPVEIADVDYCMLTFKGVVYRIQPSDDGITVTLDAPFGRSLACVGRASNSMRLRALKS